MLELLKFGNIFFIEDTEQRKEYVMLHSNGKTIDAAIILNPEKTQEVKRLQHGADRKGISYQKPLFCYVELSTEDYINCSANMISTGQNIELGPSIKITDKMLNDSDLEKIKKEILDNSDLFKPPLVEYIKSIQ